MRTLVDIEIAKPKEHVWEAITDIANCTKMISSIIDLEVLHQPDDGLVGLKWKETRLMFGKEASETMWITDAIENQYYRTRAESHGSIYISELSLSEKGDNTLLTLSFSGEAQSLFVKIVSVCMGFFLKSSMKKMLYKDLEDIKAYVEGNHFALGE